MKAPPRLLHSSEGHEALRASLTAAASAESRYDVEAGLARFQRSLAAAPSADPQPVDPIPAAASVTNFRVTAATLSTVACWLRKPSALLGAMFVNAPWQGQTTRPAGSTDLAAPAPAVTNADAGSANTSDTVARPVDVARDEPEEPPEPVAKANAAEPRASRTLTPRSEISEVLRVRATFRTEPRAALSILAQLDRDFPRGVLQEERDALTVLAHWHAGDRAIARELAQRFVARYPRSAMRQRLQELLDDAARPEAL
jgi:hypothetical protein